MKGRCPPVTSIDPLLQLVIPLFTIGGAECFVDFRLRHVGFTIFCHHSIPLSFNGFQCIQNATDISDGK